MSFGFTRKYSVRKMKHTTTCNATHGLICGKIIVLVLNVCDILTRWFFSFFYVGTYCTNITYATEEMNEGWYSFIFIFLRSNTRIRGMIFFCFYNVNEKLSEWADRRATEWEKGKEEGMQEKMDREMDETKKKRETTPCYSLKKKISTWPWYFTSRNTSINLMNRFSSLI